MATIQVDTSPHIAPAVESVLGQLRRRIRRYVWLEGLAAAVAWLGLAFWLSLGIDWLLEPAAVVRVLLAAAVAFVLGAVLVRLIGRRAFVPLSDSNMATVLERRFPKFDDSLLTAVFLTRRRPGEAEYNPRMLARTCREAAERVAGLELPEVFNPLPLRRKMAAAVFLVITVVSFALALPEAFGLWARRNLAMDNELWPRKIALATDDSVFKDGVARVAKGSDLDVVVKAVRGDTDEPVVPPTVEIRYRIEGGQRGRYAMNRLGADNPSEGVLRQYTYTFRGILAPINFDVAGGDARLRDLRIEVVDNPVLDAKETKLELEYPAYMERPKGEVDFTGAEKVPVGTRVTLRARSNKELERVRIEIPADDKLSARLQVLEGSALHPDGRGFSLALDPLRRDTTLQVRLLDTDGINSREPIRVPLVAVPDEPPQMNVRLAGIGAAITPQAHMPVASSNGDHPSISDDHGIGRVWFEYAINQEKPVVRPIAALDKHPTHYTLPGTPPDKSPETALEARELKLVPGQKLLLSVKASDLYNLDRGPGAPKGPNIGTSDRWLLDVVTPDQLRAMLEARELVLRQRFEGVIQEVQETHDLLARMDFGQAGDGEKAPAGKDVAKPAEKRSARASGSEPGEENAPKRTLNPAELLTRRNERVQQALENSRKNKFETAGVAEAFDDIRQQYVNNRIAAEDEEMVKKRLGPAVAGLQDRLGQGIVEPLNRIVQNMFPELEKRLEQLQAVLADTTAGPQRREAARQQVVDILLAMRTVLSRMSELEDYNEVVSHLRKVIDLEEKMIEMTKKKQKEAIRGSLEDK
jgi:hypothetical protein